MAIGYEDQPPPPKHSTHIGCFAPGETWQSFLAGDPFFLFEILAVSLANSIHTPWLHDLSQSKLVQSGFIQQSWRFIATQTWKSFGNNQGHSTFHPATCQTEVLDNAGLRKNGQCWARLRKAKGVWFQIGKGKVVALFSLALIFFRGGSEIWPTIWMLIHTYILFWSRHFNPNRGGLCVIIVNEHFNILEKKSLMFIS